MLTVLHMARKAYDVIRDDARPGWSRADSLAAEGAQLAPNSCHAA